MKLNAMVTESFTATATCSKISSSLFHRWKIIKLHVALLAETKI